MSDLNDELRAFTDAAVQRGTTPHDYELEETENQFEAPSGELESAADDEWVLPDGWNDWVDSLSPADIKRAQDDANWAEYAFGIWLTQREATFDDTPDAEPEPGAVPLPQTGDEVVDWIYAHAAEIRRDHQMSPGEYLAAVAGAGRAEWAAFATEAGIPLNAKPSYGQLPRRAQTEVVRNDVAQWTAKDFRR